MPIIDPRRLARDGPTLADILDWFSGRADVAGYMRYGVPTSEKERLASARALPGAPEDTSGEQDVANRYAAGYLFGQQYPHLAPYVQPAIDRIKTSDLPFFGGESPELQAWAGYGVSQGKRGSGRR